MHPINMKKIGKNTENNKMFRLKSNEIKQLVPYMGYCFASNKITVDGLKVGYMYREEPEEQADSGWRFLSGTEEQDYINDSKNIQIYDVNTIANYDKAIIPFLSSDVGCEFERSINDTFNPIL